MESQLAPLVPTGALHEGLHRVLLGRAAGGQKKKPFAHRNAGAPAVPQHLRGDLLQERPRKDKYCPFSPPW